MADEVKLLPCPFCGAAMLDYNHSDGTLFHPGTITDEDCLMSGVGVRRKDFAAWNARVSAPPGDDEVERVARAMFSRSPTHEPWETACIHTREIYLDDARAAIAAIAAVPSRGEGFQARVQPWLIECFGLDIAADKIERNHRFLEEALELVQSLGCTRSEAHQLVDYTFDRPTGEPGQEVGGTMVTLAALCLASSLDMHEAGETELARIWTKVDAIRAKHAAKPKHSPLPEAPSISAGKSE